MKTKLSLGVCIGIAATTEVLLLNRLDFGFIDGLLLAAMGGSIAGSALFVRDLLYKANKE